MGFRQFPNELSQEFLQEFPYEMLEVFDEYVDGLIAFDNLLLKIENNEIAITNEDSFEINDNIEWYLIKLINNNSGLPADRMVPSNPRKRM
jgi:hypothetical protein